MSEVTKICPICKSKSYTLQYSQNADINFELVDGKLKPILDIDEIAFMDFTSLYCHDCGASDSMDDELYVEKQKYDQLMIHKETVWR